MFDFLTKDAETLLDEYANRCRATPGVILTLSMHVSRRSVPF